MLSAFHNLDHSLQGSICMLLIHFPLIIILIQGAPCYYSILSCPKGTLSANVMYLQEED